MTDVPHQCTPKKLGHQQARSFSPYFSYIKNTRTVVELAYAYCKYPITAFVQLWLVKAWNFILKTLSSNLFVLLQDVHYRAMQYSTLATMFVNVTFEDQPKTGWRMKKELVGLGSECRHNCKCQSQPWACDAAFFTIEEGEKTTYKSEEGKVCTCTRMYAGIFIYHNGLFGNGLDKLVLQHPVCGRSQLKVLDEAPTKSTRSFIAFGNKYYESPMLANLVQFFPANILLTFKKEVHFIKITL